MKYPPQLKPVVDVATAMLMTGPKATPPRPRAIIKMVLYLMASPLHQHTMRHQRGSWRDWPRDIGRKEFARVTE